MTTMDRARLKLSAVLLCGVSLAGLIAATPGMAQTPAAAKTTAGAQPAAPAAKAAPPAGPTLASQPAPITLPAVAAVEGARIATFDKAIASVREIAPSAADAALIRDAAAAFAANDPTKAKTLRDQIADPTGRKLVDWVRLRVGLGEAAEYRAFLDANPSWPDRTILNQRMDEALFTRGGSPKAIKDAYKGGEPRTAAGFAALASAHLAEGDEKTAAALAQKAWRTLDIAATLETGFLERFGKYLTEADQKRRLDRLLMDDIRWESERSVRAAIVRRLIPKLSAAEQKRAEARLAVFLKVPLAGQMIAALPAEEAGAATDWGLAYHRIQMLRRQNQDEAAWALLRTVPTDPNLIVAPDEWWIERRSNAYQALKAGKPRVAYDLAKDAGLLSINPAKEQANFAGWIALRLLNDPIAADIHFKFMKKIADGPLSMAKADYWLGRTAEAKGDKARAAEHYKSGARFVDTFHGQLSRQRLDGSKRLDIAPITAPTPGQIASFNADDAVRAAVLARKSNLDIAITRAFLNHLARHLKTEAEVAMVAHLAEAFGDTQSAVRIGKLAIGRGFNLMPYAYPVHPMPAYGALRQPPETALMLGIARQESEFNTLTVSGAGARGILQVMPITAKHVCRDYKLKCDIPRLLTDKAYNTMIASAYIGDRMGEFQGSYVLGTAGYNAGPGRARQWMREFGDPRDPKVDVIDWIYRIPFEETREYVQKVLANTQIYRSRLGAPETALKLNDDLARARGARQAADAARPTTAAEVVEKPAASAGAHDSRPVREP
ncbi:MAG: lytic transglycosylase domain-containing protein [Hyphomicrobiaceae bacterium]